MKEISDFFTSVMWWNMKLIQMWRNFRFLHICPVQKFEISPHHRFFLHGHRPCVRDKYEVWYGQSIFNLWPTYMDRKSQMGKTGWVWQVDQVLGDRQTSNPDDNHPPSWYEESQRAAATGHHHDHHHHLAAELIFTSNENVSVPHLLIPHGHWVEHISICSG